MTKIAGYYFEVLRPDGTWSVLMPQLFKTERGAAKAARKFVEDIKAEGWPTEARVLTAPAL